MEDNAKCFIKIRKGYYEEITYKELKERRENDNTYINKKFIPIQKTLIEVSLEEYKDFYKEIERNKAEIIELLNAKSLIKTKIQRCDTLLEQINIRKSQLNQKLIEFQSQKDSQDTMIAELEEQLKGIEEEIKQVTEQLSDYRQHLAELRTKNSEITAALAKNQEKYHKTKSNLEALKNITERYEGYGNSIKKVMELKDTKKGRHYICKN